MAVSRARKPEIKLFTCCPDCRTTFRVTPELLAKADGQVRCGRCHSIFDAFIDLREDDTSSVPASPLPPAADADEDPLARTDTHAAPAMTDADANAGPAEAGERLPSDSTSPARQDRGMKSTDLTDPPPDGELSEIEAMSLLDLIEDIELPSELPADSTAPAPDLTASAMGPDGEARDSATTTDTDGAAMASEDDDVISPAEVHAVLTPDEDELPTAVPDLANAWPAALASAETTTPSTRFWAGLSAAALLTLGLQAVHHFRRELAGEPTVGPMVVAAYDRLGVAVSADIDLSQYEIVDWVAAAEPVAEGQDTLRITARIRNRGTRAAPFPDVRLKLTDRWEATIGSRIFRPDEYLADATAHDDLLAAGQTVPAVIAVLDPGPDAYGFELDLCSSSDTGAQRCATDRVFQ